MTTSFKQTEVFPIIDRIIRLACEDEADGSYISRQRIADGLLQDSEGRIIIEKARKSEPDHTSGWWARNMVDWFSAHFNDSSYRNQFERIRIDDTWAYKVTGP